MTRLLSAAAAVFAVAAPALAQAPKIGTSTLIEYTDKSLTTGGGYYYQEFVYPIEQGDKFRIQVEAFKGADMKFCVYVFQDGGAVHDQTEVGIAKVDLTLAKGLPGRKATIRICSATPGKANVLVSKVGDDPADDAKDAEIKKLKEENALLRKKLDEMQAQLADIKRLLEKKK